MCVCVCVSERKKETIVLKVWVGVSSAWRQTAPRLRCGLGRSSCVCVCVCVFVHVGKRVAAVCEFRYLVGVWSTYLRLFLPGVVCRCVSTSLLWARVGRGWERGMFYPLVLGIGWFVYWPRPS